MNFPHDHVSWVKGHLCLVISRNWLKTSSPFPEDFFPVSTQWVQCASHPPPCALVTQAGDGRLGPGVQGGWDLAHRPSQMRVADAQRAQSLTKGQGFPRMDCRDAHVYLWSTEVTADTSRGWWPTGFMCLSANLEAAWKRRYSVWHVWFRISVYGMTNHSPPKKENHSDAPGAPGLQSGPAGLPMFSTSRITGVQQASQTGWFLLQNLSWPVATAFTEHHEK